MTEEAEAVELEEVAPEVFTTWHTEATAGDFTVTIDTDPAEGSVRAIVSLGSWRLTPTGTTHGGYQQPAVHFECDRAALQALATAFQAAAEAVEQKHTPAEVIR